jgi:hypothetical protein
LDSLFRFREPVARLKTSESSEASVTETPEPIPPKSDPLIEEPQRTPPHVPELPPLHDPEPQRERTRS